MILFSLEELMLKLSIPPTLKIACNLFAPFVNNCRDSTVFASAPFRQPLRRPFFIVFHVCGNLRSSSPSRFSTCNTLEHTQKYGVYNWPYSDRVGPLRVVHHLDFLIIVPLIDIGGLRPELLDLPVIAAKLLDLNTMILLFDGIGSSTFERPLQVLCKDAGTHANLTLWYRMFLRA